MNPGTAEAAADEQRTILTLVRHGQTSANIDMVWHGSSDTPLTDHGATQAERVAGFLAERFANATQLYASPLQRARNTAAPIGLRFGLAPQIEDELTEYDIGAWEGKSMQALHEEHALWDHIAKNPDFAPHGGESPRQVTERMTGCLRRLHGKHPGERVIVVTHGGALSLALTSLLGGADGTFVHVMKNCAVTELSLDPQPELLSFNLDAHLEEV